MEEELMHELADRAALKMVRTVFWTRREKGLPNGGFDFRKVYDNEYQEAIYAYATHAPANLVEAGGTEAADAGLQPVHVCPLPEAD